MEKAREDVILILKKVWRVVTRKEVIGMGVHERVQTPDLRPMPLFERHEKIFRIWDSLQPGETLRIINDPTPKPLHYPFEAEQKGKFE